jgi:Ca2+-transporting ATPase
MGDAVGDRGEVRAAGEAPLAAVKRPRPVEATAEQEARSWHTLDVPQALALLQTSPQFGLRREAAHERLAKYGPNLLPQAEPRSALSIFLGQFNSLPVALLTGSALLSAFTGGLVDALVIMGVVVTNAVIGYVTESQAELTINALSRMVRPSAVVIRDGTAQEIGAEDIVLGDLLVLAPGSYVPADARLVEVKRLSVDESALTGESMPAVKATTSLARRGVPLADRTNMVYMGTLVTGGSGCAVAVATGKHTEIGQIQALVSEACPPETPMQRQLDAMGSQLVWLSGAICAAVFGVGLLRGYGLMQMLKASISLAVAAVPEGLPTIATTTLALGIRNMRRHKVLIRHLDAVETLGAVQVICLDKTGTITMNTMSVMSVYAGMRHATVQNGALAFDPSAPVFARRELQRLLEISVLCNETEVNSASNRYELKGSPTERALVQAAIDVGMDVTGLRQRHPVLKIRYRSEKRNFMLTVHGADNGEKLIAVKGSPAEVLAMCRWHATADGMIALTEADRLAIITENERMAGGALRVLGVAYEYSEDGRAEEYDSLIWVGLIAMVDPVRDGVKALIGRFHQAGIDTIMITGDQSPTAYAIGKELNLGRGRLLEILDSTHLETLEPEVLKALAQRVHVFARVSPAHKLKIVQALQLAGKVVGMTGDGINDGPALKAADIGIAMGDTGTEVARTVADVVIEDDNLQTLVEAVSQGRTIYTNIRKSIHFLLATNMSEIIVMFGAIAVGLGQPLTPMQLLAINLVTDIFPGLALAMESPEPDVLHMPPRDPRDPIIRASDFKRIGLESAVISAGTLAAYGYGVSRYGIGARASTLAFTTLTSAQLLHALSARSEHYTVLEHHKLPPNRYLTLALAGSAGIQLLSVLLPGLRGLLGVTPISLGDILVMGAGATLPLLTNEVTKTIEMSRLTKV